MEKEWLEPKYNEICSWNYATYSKKIYSLKNNNSYMKEAYIIVKDYNLGGSYYKYFTWLNNNNGRYLKLDSKWIFDVPLYEMKNNMIVKNIETNEEFIVNDKFNNNNVKILERKYI